MVRTIDPEACKFKSVTWYVTGNPISKKKDSKLANSETQNTKVVTLHVSIEEVIYKTLNLRPQTRNMRL